MNVTRFLLSAVLFTGLASSAQAVLLVYEGFDYELDPTKNFTHIDDTVAFTFDGLAKNGGMGFGGPWEDMTSGSNAGIPGVFGPLGMTEIRPGATGLDKPDWDGVMSGVAQTGGYVGLSPVSNDQFEDRINARRPLGATADVLAGDDNTLWASMVVHFEDSRFFFAPAFALTTGGGFEERSLMLSDGSDGLGIGNGSPINSGINTADVMLAQYIFGVRDEFSKTDVSNLDTAIADYLIVLKYEFGEAQDTLSGAVFAEGSTISEAEFNTNAVSTVVFIDESTLNTLAVGMTRAGNAYDELRLGDTFDDVAPLVDVPMFILGDTNNDGTVDTLDIDPFVLLLTDPAGYATAFPGVDALAVGDINMDDVVDTLDIDPFVALLTAGSLNGGAVPEPSTMALLALGGVAGLALRRRS